VHVERRLDLYRILAQSRSVQDREGRSAQQGYPARAAAQGAGGAVRPAYVFLAYADGLFEEPGGGEGIPQMDPFARKLREVVQTAEGLRDAANLEVGNPQAVGRGSGDGPLQGRGPARPSARLCGSRQQESGGGADQIFDRRHVRQGDPGYAARGSG